MPEKLNLKGEDAKMRGDTWRLELRFMDMTKVCDGVCTLAAKTKIGSASAAFSSVNLRKLIKLAGAGVDGKDYSGHITAIDSTTQVTVCPAISTAVSGAELSFGFPIDITGDELWWTLKHSNDDADDDAAAQFRATMPADSNSADGIGFALAPSDETVLVAPKTYSYDIQRVVPGAPPEVNTPVYGVIEVLADTTRSVA